MRVVRALTSCVMVWGWGGHEFDLFVPFGRQFLLQDCLEGLVNHNTVFTHPAKILLFLRAEDDFGDHCLTPME